ncbi:MAG: phosphatidylcholine/phosphatidylserine synthase [Pseudomonadota bacterium]
MNAHDQHPAGSEISRSGDPSGEASLADSRPSDGAEAKSGSPRTRRRRARRLIRRRRAGVRLREASINRLLPNIVTLLALCAGLTAVRFALQDQWQAAVGAIILAAVLDGIDGRIARLLDATSPIGALLDTLSDFVCFGVVPVIVLYLWLLSDAGSLGWAAVLAFSVCSALRLARFTASIGQGDLPPFAFNYFVGVPMPAAAGLVLLPMIGSFLVAEYDFDVPIPAHFLGIWVLAIALLMVSRIPTFSGKAAKIPQRFVLPLLAGIGLFAAFLATAPWATLVAIGAAYFISIPFSVRQYRRLQRAAARIESGTSAQEAREKLDDDDGEDISSTDSDDPDALPDEKSNRDQDQP